MKAKEEDKPQATPSATEELQSPEDINESTQDSKKLETATPKFDQKTTGSLIADLSPAQADKRYQPENDTEGQNNEIQIID